MTREEFAEKLKTKYPEWGKMENDDLVNSVLERYPMYRSQITDTPTALPQQTMEEPVAKPGFFSRAGTALKDRFGMIKQTFGEQSRGDINPLETGVRVVGDVISGAGDIIGAALSPQIEKLAQKEWAKPAFNALAQGMDKYEEWKNSSELNRRTGEMIEGVVNIADLAGVVGGSKAVGRAGIKAGTKVARVGREFTEEAGERIAKSTEIIRQTAKEILPEPTRVINSEVAKALDLNANDVKNIALSSGNQVGEWISDKNLLKGSRKETIEAVKQQFNTQYKEVRDILDNVDTKYKANDVPRYKDALNIIKQEIEKIPGLEADVAIVDSLLNKKSIVLQDVQKAKELLDRHFNLYKTTGDVREGAMKEGIRRVRTDLKEFIENEVEVTTGANIRQLNNDVSTAKGILVASKARATRGLTRANLSLSDLGILGAGSMFGTPLTGAALLLGKKILQSSSVRLRVARWFEKLSKTQKAKAIQELESGKIPTGIKMKTE